MPHNALYRYDSCVGVFWIAQAPHGGGRVLLGIDDLDLGSYWRAEQAADDVYLHHTSHAPWDDRTPSSGEPTGLEEWARVS